VVDQHVKRFDAQRHPGVLAQRSGGAEGLDAILVLLGAGKVLQFVAHLGDDLAAAELPGRRQRVFQRCHDPLGAARGHQRAAGIAGQAYHLHAELLANPGEAVHVAPPPAPELEGVHARRLHFGRAFFKGDVRKQGVDAHCQTRPRGRRRGIAGSGEVALDRGARGGRGSQAEQLATGQGSVHGVVSSTR